MLSQCDLAFMAGLNERDRRLFIGTKAEQLKANGVSYRKISNNMGISTHTIRKSFKELRFGTDLPEGRVRHEGGGRKRDVPRHPEWTEAVKEIIEPHTAGLPQDEGVVWISLSIKQIMDELKSLGIDISRYLVKQILDSLHLRERSFYKELPMKEVKDRNEQFEQIASVRKATTDINIPVISVDTKKKEMAGNFKRPGKALSNGSPKAFDHDFATFRKAQEASGVRTSTRKVELPHKTKGLRQLIFLALLNLIFSGNKVVFSCSFLESSIFSLLKAS